MSIAGTRAEQFGEVVSMARPEAPLAKTLQASSPSDGYEDVAEAAAAVDEERASTRVTLTLEFERDARRR